MRLAIIPPTTRSTSGPSIEKGSSIAGWLALIACFLLLSPGVRVVRADPTDAATQAAPALPAQDLDVVVSTVDGEIEVSPRRVDPKAEAVDGSVVLNTRGYNYGPERPTARPALAAPAAPAAEEPAAAP